MNRLQGWWKPFLKGPYYITIIVGKHLPWGLGAWVGNVFFLHLYIDVSPYLRIMGPKNDITIVQHHKRWLQPPETHRDQMHHKVLRIEAVRENFPPKQFIQIKWIHCGKDFEKSETKLFSKTCLVTPVFILCCVCCKFLGKVSKKPNWCFDRCCFEIASKFRIFTLCH